MSFRRIGQDYHGMEAKVHRYQNGTARIVVELTPEDAEEIVSSAIGSGGSLPLELIYSGQRLIGSAVNARMSTYAPSGAKETGPGVISFSELSEDS